MPYRRLPKTDAARIATLEKAVDMDIKQSSDRQPASFKSLNQAKVLLPRFIAMVKQFRYHYDELAKYNSRLQPLGKTARLYISHFIQVLNMTILRNEIKEQYKPLYGLQPHDYTLPDLSTEAALVKWGENIIIGENRRLSQRGGTPIYNPTIAKVKVHYDIFIEARNEREHYKNQMQRSLEKLNEIRSEVDAVILDIWNQVEVFYSDLPLTQRIDKCREYGIIYYYRKNEKAQQQ
ncbi:MAG: hypothetical protein IKJ79_00500 [Bacteroidaceae bacterium]|nr:hypothetical protein [Bacteroidaceae bacterium]MBR6758007.1 hypothetical protein [Bacteroidaceae bacterium]